MKLKLKGLLLLYVIILLTACHVQQILPTPDEMHPDVSSGVKSKDINQQTLISEPELDSNLCLLSEEIIISFKFVDSDKILTVAASKEQDYLVCRMGTKDAIELEFPQDKTNSWDQFEYSYYMRGGGPENLGMSFDHLSFETDSFSYEVYYEYNSADEEQLVGLHISEKGKESNMVNLKGDIDSVIGGLDQLQDTKIKKSFG